MNAEPARQELLAATEAAQGRASSPEASAWVSANAGAGKTHVLKLRVLRLSGNRLTSLPAQIRMLRLLEDLSCDANEVGDLPETVNELVNLRNLNVRQNAISSLPELGDLKHLEILIASSNCLESLETVSLEKLTSLRKLFINGNKINEFPAKDIIALAKDGCLDKANFANNCLKLPLPAEIISELGDKLIV